MQIVLNFGNMTFWYRNERRIALDGFAHETTVFFAFPWRKRFLRRRPPKSEAEKAGGERRRRKWGLPKPDKVKHCRFDHLKICKLDMLRIKYRSLNGCLPPEVSQWYWFPLIRASTSSNSDVPRCHVNFHLGFVESSSDPIHLTNFTASFSMAGQSAARREFLWRIFLRKLCDK